MRAIICQAIRQLEQFEALPHDERLEDWELSIQWIVDSVENQEFKLGCPAVVEACQIPGRGLRWAKRVLAICLAACEEPRTVLTPPEIAEQLATAPETVVGWIKSGQLKASNLATGSRPRYVVPPDALAEFLGKRQPEPPAPGQKRAKTTYRKFSE